LGNGAWQDLMSELAVQLTRRSAESYFRGARVHLETGDRVVGKAQLEELVALLAKHEMSLSSVVGQVTGGKVPAPRPTYPSKARPAPASALKPLVRPPTKLPAVPSFAGPKPATERRMTATMAARLPRPLRTPVEELAAEPPQPGLVPETADVPPERLNPPIPDRRGGLKFDNPLQASQALLIRRTVRSGQVIHYAGTVVVFGDVNPAAEVIAEGDVIILGRLRGVVHAGAAGNEEAVVGALILAPTQVRIGEQVARAPDEKRWHPWPAEIARVRGGQIIVEPWGVA
jgi:septum site-determining protein MinC